MQFKVDILWLTNQVSKFLFNFCLMLEFNARYTDYTPYKIQGSFITIRKFNSDFVHRRELLLLGTRAVVRILYW